MLGGLLLLVACEGGPSGLAVVELRSDLRVGADVTEARTSLLPAEGGDILRETTVSLEGRDLVAGTRVAELSDLERATYRVLVELLDAGGAVVAERLTLADFGPGVGVTVVILRSCVGISCDADPAVLASCSGGSCVDPGCSPENPSACPPPRCLADADCPVGGAACMRPVCFEGDCGYAMDEACACDPVAGLVAAYDFEEGAGTTSASRPSGLDATMSRGLWSSATGSPCGGALLLDAGMADFADLPRDPTIDGVLDGDFTFVVWVRSTQAAMTGHFPTLLSNENATAPRNGTSLVLSGSELEPDGTWYFEIYDGTDPFQARGGVVTDDAWHQLAGVRQADRLLAYEDGMLVADTAASGVALAPRQNVRVGEKPTFTSTTYAYGGYLDAVRIYGRALSADEVLRVYRDHRDAGCLCE